MNTITTKDGTTIFYKDWGNGQPIVFSHGWPLSADDWDTQMLFFGQRGYRVIAHDRRGHGRSTQTWDGNDMDTYADDLAVLTEKLDLRNAIHVGHSTGGGEVARYIGRHGNKRVAMAVLNQLGATVDAEDGQESWRLADDGVRWAEDGNLPQIGRSSTGTPRCVLRIQPAGRDDFGRDSGHWWYQGMMGGMKAHYDCIKAFRKRTLRGPEEVRGTTLVMHGDDDQIVPIGASGLMSAKIVKNATLKVYPGYPHGMFTTHADEINADLLAFMRKSQQVAA